MLHTLGSARRAARWLARAALACAVTALWPLAQAAAQQTGQESAPGGRWKVLVVPLQGINARFGDRVADLVIADLKNFPTHTAIPKDELRKACKTYGVRCEELNAITSRQMAAQLKAQVVMFGTVKPAADGYQVEAAFTDVKTGEEIKVPQVNVPKTGAEKKIAQAIVSSFEEAVNFQRAKTFCQQYVGSNQPQNALENCDRALAISPTSTVALYYKGAAYRQMAEGDGAGSTLYYDSAIAYYEKTLDVQPGHKDALQALAYVHSKKGDARKAFELYRQFLELDPRNSTVRLAVAHDLASGGLVHEAIQLLNEGLALDSTQIDLWKYKGDLSLSFASAAGGLADSAQKLRSAGRTAEAENVARRAKLAEVFGDTAITAYRYVYAARGAEADSTLVTNLLAAYVQADKLNEAIQFARGAVQTHGTNAGLWSQYAIALSKAERHDEALAALDTVLRLDPNYPNVFVRRGLYRLAAGEEAGAQSEFARALERREVDAPELTRHFFGEGLQAFRQKKYDRARNLYRMALEYCKDQRQCSEINFFLGYALYEQAAALDEREDLESIRRALQLFQEAKPHLEKGKVARAKDAENLLENLDVFIFREQQRIRQAQRTGG